MDTPFGGVRTSESIYRSLRVTVFFSFVNGFVRREDPSGLQLQPNNRDQALAAFLSKQNRTVSYTKSVWA